MLLALLIAVTAWLLGMLLPWWSVAIPGLIFGGWLGKNKSNTFLNGFLGIGVLWLIQVFYIHIANDGLLTSRITELFNLHHPGLVILITVVIGGLAGGLCALTSFLFTDYFLEDTPANG